MTVPYVAKYQMDQTSLGATVDVSMPMFVAPFAAQVTLVQYVPAQTQTSDTAVASTVRTYSLYNRLGTGAGTTRLACGAITSASASITAFGTSTSAGLTDNIASSIPLTTTALLTLAAGDVIEWESSHSGATGLRDVGGTVIVTLSRI